MPPTSTPYPAPTIPTMPAKPTPSTPPRPKSPAKRPYAVGSGGRSVGIAHKRLVPQLRAWAKLLGGPKAMADRIQRTSLGTAKSRLLKRKRLGEATAKPPEAKSGRMHPSMISKVLHARAMFPEDAMLSWAVELGLNPIEREALLDVSVLANAPRRILSLFNWQHAVRERGEALVRATEARLKREAGKGRRSRSMRFAVA